MLHYILIPVLLVLSFISTGCNSQFMSDVAELKQRMGEINDLQTHLSQQKNEIAQLNKAIEQLSLQLESHRKELTQVRSKLTMHEITQDAYKNATFDPASGEGFSRLDTSVGSFAVSVQDVKAHADGVKVRLHVGNLTTASVNGGTFKVQWGTRMPSLDGKENWLDHYEEWQRSLKEKEVPFTEVLRPATWNNVTLTLPNTSPQQFGYMKLSMDTNQISLLQPK